MKILTGVLVHRVTRPLRGSVSCGSGWSVPCVSIQLTLSQFKSNTRPSLYEEARQSLATGAAAIVQLVSLLNGAALAAEGAVQSDPHGDRLRRVRDGGGGLQGVKAQLKRQQGILRCVRAARLAVEHATASLAALRLDGLAHLRLRAELRLQSALASERALYVPTSASYLARHDRSLHRALLRPFGGPPEQAAAARASLVASRVSFAIFPITANNCGS